MGNGGRSELVQIVPPESKPLVSSPILQRYDTFIASVDNYKHGGMLLYLGLAAGSEGVGQTALAAVLTILVEGHEDAGPALGSGTFTAEALDLSVRLNLIILQNCHLDLLPLVLNLLGGL